MPVKYYAIGASFKPRWYWGKVLTPIDNERLAERGMKDFHDIVDITIVEGEEAGDFLWTGVSILVCSPRVLTIWGKYRTFETFRVNVADFRDFKYTGIAITGRGGQFDPVRSKPKYFQGTDGAKRPAILRMEGLFFNESQWDGSDIFHIDEFPCISILTGRVVEEMKNAHITNCRYTPLEDYGNTQKTIASTRKPDAY
jgi:hypothetical protein